MKLATYKDGSRDGQLVVVSRDLSMAHYATGVASTLQTVLDDWNFMAPQLQDLYVTLNQGKARHAFPFDARMCMAPLPRAYQWVEAETSLAELESSRQKPRAASGRVSAGVPRLRQGTGDGLLGACEDVLVSDEAWNIDFGAGVAVITGDVVMGASPGPALESVRLLMLCNSMSLRGLMAGEVALGHECVHGKPAVSFSPVAVTPDELGDAWQGGRVHLTLHTAWNDRKVGMCDAGEQPFHFGQLMAHLCKTRNLSAGTILGSGAVVNVGLDDSGQRQWPKGYSSIEDKRAAETLLDGQATTGYLRFGDTVRIEMKGRDGQSLFGAIEQTISPAG